MGAAEPAADDTGRARAGGFRPAAGTARWIAMAALLGVVLRVAFALGYWTGQPLTRDEREYLSLARSLSAGHGFVYDAEQLGGRIQPFGRAPGYPVFLALVGGGGPPAASVPRAVQVAQSITAALGIVLAALIAGRVAGDRAARATAVLTAVYPPLVWLAAYAYSEALFWPVGVLVIVLFDRTVRTGSRAGAAAAAIATAAGLLIRPALVLFVPLAVLWLLVKRRVAAAAILGLTVALVLAPWVAENYARHGRFVLVATEGGVTFWTGNNALARGEGDMAANPAIKRASQALAAAHPGLTEDQLEPVYYQEAFAWMRAHPGAWLRLEARKLFFLIVPVGPSYTTHSRRYFVASVVSYGLILFAAAVGLGRGGRRWGRTPGLWLMFAGAIAVCLMFFPQERFRVPVIDPTLLICAGAAWSRRERPRPA
jgi:hypothetical protein